MFSIICIKGIKAWASIKLREIELEIVTLKVEKLALFSSMVLKLLDDMVSALFFSWLSLVKPANFDIADFDTK